MSPEISSALLVMAVGMIIVFTILGLVVLSGHILIRLVNRYAPVQEPYIRHERRRKAPQRTFSEQKLAVIVAAVDIHTKGRGRVTKVEPVQ